MKQKAALIFSFMLSLMKIKIDNLKAKKEQKIDLIRSGQLGKITRDNNQSMKRMLNESAK